MGARIILPKPDPLGCYECGLPYGEDGWIEAVVPNDVWERISPGECPGSGILCICCVSSRCAKLGLEDVPVRLCGTEPLKCEPDASLRARLTEAEEALADMLSGWRYIREHHGDLYGVAWDRCEARARAIVEPTR